jgi:hypothetical protein
VTNPVDAQITPRLTSLRPPASLGAAAVKFAAIASNAPAGCDLVHTHRTPIGLPVGNGPHDGDRAWRSQMAALARVLTRVSGTRIDVETLKTIAMFCGVGLTVSLLLASYGLDLSPGFF